MNMEWLKKIFSLWIMLILLVVIVKAQNSERKLVLKAAPSGPDKILKSRDWSNIPDLSVEVTTAENGQITATVSVEVIAVSKKMFVRIIVDNSPALPSSVVFVAETTSFASGVRSFTFVKGGLSAGKHSVSAQCSIDVNGVAQIGDRTLAILSYPSPKFYGVPSPVPPFGYSAAVASASNKSIKVPYNKTVVIDMFNILLPHAGRLAITYSAESEFVGPFGMRALALIDGKEATPARVDYLTTGGPFSGVSSCTFITDKHYSTGPHLVQIQGYGMNGTGLFKARTLAINLVDFPGEDFFYNTSPETRRKYIFESVNFNRIGELWVKDLSTGEEGKMMITITADASITKNGRLFARVLIDGQPADPSDVLFAIGDTFKGTRSFTFVKSGLTPYRKYPVEVEWGVDAGTSATIRAVTYSAFGK